ncbi:acyltransferase family protein [Microbacterium sp. P01]|uniref:acyltransferase family protein n=1 Tax=unclassified Microbacterium TaxID=2609290 RepID=UPI00366C6D00
MMRKSLEDVFDPRLNALNAVRLLLAAGVLLRHSFTMLGTSTGIVPLETIMRSAFVDGFFAISGYLIVSSWIRRPDWRAYARARCLRILPAFWVCLGVTALILSPLHALITGHPMSPQFWADSLGYIWRNWFLWIFQEGIDGTPTGAAPAESGVWNGSLWTLAWEFICYIAVLALGLIGLLNRRAVVASLFVISLLTLVVVKPLFPELYLLHHAARFGTMFLAGAVLYVFRTKLPASPWLVLLSACLVVLSGWLPDYRLVAALPLAYLCIVGGALIKVPALRLRNDISYGTYIYGYPAQQMLIGLGLAGAGVAGFFLMSVAAVIPLAVASWFLIERPAQKLRFSGQRTRDTVSVTPGRPG